MAQFIYTLCNAVILFLTGPTLSFLRHKKPVKHSGFYMYHPLLTYKNSMFSPYSVFVCSVWLS